MKQIPSYTISSFFEKRNRYCICVFVINEWERIRKQLCAMKSFASSVDIIVADGWSTDNSLEQSFLLWQNVRACLVKTGSWKLSSQMRMAFDYALEQGYEWIIVVDWNNKDDISAIPRFIDSLNSGYDHIQWSRYIQWWQEENTPFMRKWGVRLLHAPLIAIAARFPYTDTTNWFRAYSRRLLLDSRLAVFRDIFNTYELHYYLAIQASRLWFKCIEVPVTRKYPLHEKTPTKIKWIRGNLHILKILFSACFWLYNPK